MASVPYPQSTTESATNRIDLDSLSAALTAAGWTRYVRHPLDLGTSWKHGYRHIWAADDGAFLIWNQDSGAVTITESIWQHALDIIREHTTRAPRRSRDQAGMAEEES